LTERERQREQEHKQEAGGVGEGEAGLPWSRKPDAGPDPRTLGPRPEPKADAQRLSHPGAPIYAFQCFPWCFYVLTYKYDKISFQIPKIILLLLHLLLLQHEKFT